MATLKELQQRVLALQGNEITYAVEAINESEKLFLDLNASQLAQGFKKNDKQSNFAYSPTTIAIKKAKQGIASIVSHLTNYDTGESYKRLYMIASETDVKVGTTSGLEEEISSRMDGQAFGLNTENREVFLKEGTQNIFIKKIKKALNL